MSDAISIEWNFLNSVIKNLLEYYQRSTVCLLRGKQDVLDDGKSNIIRATRDGAGFAKVLNLDMRCR